jgi:hypothetical protein
MVPYAQRRRQGRALSRLIGCIAVCILFVFAASAPAHPPELAKAALTPPGLAISQSAQNLTLTLLGNAKAVAAARLNARARAVASLVATARSRHEAILALLDIDPAEALKVALPANLRARFPGEAAPFVEQDVQEDGTLEVSHVDYEDPALDHYEYALNTTSHGKLRLYFASKAPELLTGAHVRVSALKIDSALLAASDSSVTTTTTKAAVATLPGTLGAQRTLTILVNFTDDTSQPFTNASAQSTMFGTVSNYWYEASYQQTTLTGDVAGWFTLSSVSTTTCNTSAIQSGAQAAAQAAGFNLSSYTRFLYVFPGSSCSWWGYSMIGGTPSQSWIAAKNGFTLTVIGHELGHALGLYHSHALDCGGVAIASSGCTAYEYGDGFDIMGGVNTTPHYNAFQKERLGWLNAGISPPITSAADAAGTSVNYGIETYENSRDLTSRALKIPRAGACGSAPDYFYLESRQAIGFDTFIAGDAGLSTGVLMHAATPGSANSSYLLDMTPATTTWLDPALPAGATFTDPTSGLAIMPVSAGSSGATINVTYPPASCTHAAPTIVLTPSGTEYANAGATASYTATVTNNDGCGCSSSTFNVSASVPAGWTANNPQTASVAPGASISTPLNIGVPSTAAAAYYTVPSTAANASATSYWGTVNGTVAVTTTTGTGSSSISASVASSQPTYTAPVKPSQTKYASIGTTVTSSGSPVAGAKVNVKIISPSGNATTVSATTGSNGVANVSYPIRGKNVIGTYSVTSTASYNFMTGTATTSFAVK